MSPTRFAILNAEALDDKTGLGALAAEAAEAVAPGVGDFGEGLGPPALHVGVGLGVTVSLDDPGDKDGDGDVVKSISCTGFKYPKYISCMCGTLLYIPVKTFKFEMFPLTIANSEKKCWHRKSLSHS